MFLRKFLISSQQFPSFILPCNPLPPKLGLPLRVCTPWRRQCFCSISAEEVLRTLRLSQTSWAPCWTCSRMEGHFASRAPVEGWGHPMGELSTSSQSVHNRLQSFVKILMGLWDHVGPWVMGHRARVRAGLGVTALCCAASLLLAQEFLFSLPTPQLPDCHVETKERKIGKLSIKIPWKKLGWDPIVIVLEDVFICACSRDSHEKLFQRRKNIELLVKLEELTEILTKISSFFTQWSLQLVEKRELAGKMAKLNAAELAKFSKRVYGKCG
ncbi:hypothetical protein Taro_012179 [Colocasia esculenta]|uniref:Uncharacterized protein n=1 Tax=Colocasia esculenta TaxID=4460 RepID=A0A843UCY0_COLES|nr:hypothetical protein [Colocasia esculenta]